MDKKTSAFNGPVVKRLGEILHDSDGLVTLVKLNILFIFTAFPFLPFITVLTAGGALTALLQCSCELVRTGYLSDCRARYMKIFKNSFKNTIKTGSVIVVLNAVLIFDVFYYLIKSGDNLLLVPVASASLLGIIILGCISCHLFSRENTDNIPLKEQLKQAVTDAFRKPGKTLAAVILSGIFLTFLVLFLPGSLPVLLTIGFSVPALAYAFAHTEPEW